MGQHDYLIDGERVTAVHGCITDLPQQNFLFTDVIKKLECNEIDEGTSVTCKDLRDRLLRNSHG